MGSSKFRADIEHGTSDLAKAHVHMEQCSRSFELETERRSQLEAILAARAVKQRQCALAVLGKQLYDCGADAVHLCFKSWRHLSSGIVMKRRLKAHEIVWVSREVRLRDVLLTCRCMKEWSNAAQASINVTVRDAVMVAFMKQVALRELAEVSCVFTH